MICLAYNQFVCLIAGLTLKPTHARWANTEARLSRERKHEREQARHRLSQQLAEVWAEDARMARQVHGANACSAAFAFPLRGPVARPTEPRRETDLAAAAARFISWRRDQGPLPNRLTISRTGPGRPRKTDY